MPENAAAIDINAQDRFVLRQHIKLVINTYEFALPEREDAPFCFVEQKRFKFKEDIRFFADESKGVELLRIKARQRFDPRARYDITDGSGQKIGEIQKVFGKSLLRSTYALFDASGEEVAMVREVKLWVALFRRTVGLIPYLGDVADWLPIPYDFEFRSGEELLGTNRRRRWKFRDIYDINLEPDTAHRLDRRLVLAACVGMDALQAR